MVCAGNKWSRRQPPESHRHDSSTGFKKASSLVNDVDRFSSVHVTRAESTDIIRKKLARKISIKNSSNMCGDMKTVAVDIAFKSSAPDRPGYKRLATAFADHLAR
jgi:hypothetical protein